MFETKIKTTTKAVFSLIEKYKLYVLPLHSINKNNQCTCGNLNCKSPGKHPFFKYNWKKIATNDLKKINYWNKKYKNLNWAVLTGKQSPINNKYLIVIDVDSKDHDYIKTLTNTFSYSTGNGYHFWYWSDKSISNSVSVVDDNIDVRGSNGYVVIPPSKHISGKKYKLFKTFHEISDMPNHILEHSSDNKTVNDDKKELNHKLVTYRSNHNNFFNTPIKKLKEILNNDPNYRIKLGARNNTIFKLLCSDRYYGFDKQNLIEKGLYYRNFCEDKKSFTIKEIKCIVNSVVKYSPGNSSFFICRPKNYFDEDLKFIKKCLEPTNICGISLIKLCKIREDYYHKKEIKNIPDITYQEFANLLKKCGITHKKTKNGNLWFCVDKNIPK